MLFPVWCQVPKVSASGARAVFLLSRPTHPSCFKFSGYERIVPPLFDATLLHHWVTNGLRRRLQSRKCLTCRPLAGLPLRLIRSSRTGSKCFINLVVGRDRRLPCMESANNAVSARPSLRSAPLQFITRNWGLFVIPHVQKPGHILPDAPFFLFLGMPCPRAFLLTFPQARG